MSRPRKIAAALAAAVAAILTVGLARGGQNMPPAVGVCAQARVAQRGVDIPANARVVSMQPSSDGRHWACWVEGKTP